jgi:hypothetical protein
MAICDRGGLPIAVHVASASPYEPHLVPATLDARFLPDRHNCRRVVTRWERHVGNYLGMVQLACARILLRAFMR